MSTNNNLSHVKTDLASAFTAVCAYHPWRTLATRSMAGMAFTLNPSSLYAGFIPSVAGSHQLFVISSVYYKCRSEWGNSKAAIVAGIASAPSITVCDGLTCRKQLKSTTGFIFRGFIPTVFRQVGLAYGMFVFPAWIQHYISDNKTIASFGGGCLAALLTHYPDTVRVVLQSHQEMKIGEACRTAFSRMFSQAGVVSCAMRICVLAIAFTVMHMGKTHYSKIFNHQGATQ